ncbi:MAG: hypothetical protein GKR88_02405 [Flavobacteriaceae bacterium]|nr:MAG: hypothetical protein GKR88_02405 [Flavobacteriaceae bacterium]
MLLFIYGDDNTYRSTRTKLGNVNTGDGYKFRGRGIFQLTGSYNNQSGLGAYDKIHCTSKCSNSRKAALKICEFF